MKHFIFIFLLFVIGLGIFFSCAKYKDPAPRTDPRLTNPYCNDPAAVNYNWGFPGKPDNTICFYPTDLFRGVYLFNDSVYLNDTLFIYADTLALTFDTLAGQGHIKLLVSGLCNNGNVVHMTAGPTYIATVDTNAGDTLTTNLGWQFCRAQDTLTGTIAKDRINDSLLHVVLEVVSDTGRATHIGSAYLKR